MSEDLSMPFSGWPPLDRELWLACAAEADGYLDAPPLGECRSSSRNRARLVYGQWLRWLSEEGLLQPEFRPAARATSERMAGFIKAVQARHAHPRTAANYVGLLLAALGSLDPTADLSAYRAVHLRMKRRSRRLPYANAFIVHAEECYGLGLELMDKALMAAADGTGEPDPFVDGLMIALLTALPLRIGNFCAFRLGHELTRAAGIWRLNVEARDTKTYRADVSGLPESSGSYLDHYVDVVRPRLLARRGLSAASVPAFWLRADGHPLLEQTMRKRIKRQTAEAFGRPILPHSFRKVAVTTFAIERHELGAYAPALLGHTSGRTTEKHYFQAQGRIAISRYHKALDERLRRLKPSVG